MAIATLLVTDVLVYRDALVQALAHSAMHVVAHAATRDEALAALRSTRPQVAAMNLPVPQGPLSAEALRRATPALAIVAFGLGDAEVEVVAWGRAGALACLHRGDGLHELVGAVERASRGEMTCSPSLAGVLLRHATKLHAPANGHNSTNHGLTAREEQILMMIARGMPNKDIARVLHIELPTVKTHVRSLFGKLNIHRRQDATVFAPSQFSGDLRD